MNNVIVEGIELVRVKKSAPLAATITEHLRRVMASDNRGIMESVRNSGVCTNPRFDEFGDMESDQGAIYAMPGRQYTTKDRIDAYEKRKDDVMDELRKYWQGGNKSEPKSLD